MLDYKQLKAFLAVTWHFVEDDIVEVVAEQLLESRMDRLHNAVGLMGMH